MIFNNRLAASYDPITDITTYRNLGPVHKYGIDGSIAYQPIRPVTLYVFGSYLHSEIKDDVQTGADGAGNPVYAPTAGKHESGSPTYTLGGRAQYSSGPVTLGVQVKRTGPRYVFDTNLPLYATDALAEVIYPAKTPAYTTVDLDAKLAMGWAGLNDKTYIQVNVSNLFNEFYVGGFSDGLQQTFSHGNGSAPFAQIGSPRAFMATLNVEF